MTIHLHIIGALFMLLALIHLGFPRYFDWKQQLASLSLINRQMMQVHTFFIAFVVFLIGALCFSSAEELIATPLGRRICLGLGVFWGIRALVQWFVYSKELWRGRRFETGVHVVFSVLWVYCSMVFICSAFKGD
ncbi:MAG TPA: hypothetical protein PKJ19_06445 [Flavobacteriales bacterium]|nr:hypothetical protein [Flavobacteriales bacterium]HNU55299.1 hypothetical protein [Flavobacteriales bacterium]